MEERESYDLLLIIKLGATFSLACGKKGRLSPSFSRPCLWTLNQTKFMHLICRLPCFSIEVTELAVWGLDLPGVDLGVVCEDILPPSLLIQLFKMNEDRSAII